jgi:4-amino-4-deoxy-L-arabinose transferase-like glycosyltransferase
MRQTIQGWRPYALLLLLCLGLYVPGMAALPVMDRDEARFAQATRQMLESGDFLRIRFRDEARNKKPAGIYWLQAAAVAALSDAASAAIWPYRLPSLLGATAAVLLTFLFGARLFAPEAALLGAALLGASLALVAEAHLAKTDAVLLAFCVAAQGALGEIYRAARRRGAAERRWVLLFWAAQGGALLIKGPIAPLLSALTAIALTLFDREWRWLKTLQALWGVPLMLIIAAPWFLAITAATGGTFIEESVGHDFLGKIMGVQEAHGAPPGTYLLLLILTFWPGSLFLGGAIARAWRERDQTSIRFLAAWVVPFWIVLELVPTKLPHYVLPVYPALALLAGHAIAEAGTVAAKLLPRIIYVLWGAASLALAAALAMAPFSLGRGLSASGIVLAAVILIFMIRMLRRVWRGATTELEFHAVGLALLVVPAALSLEAPRLDRLWLSRSAAMLVERYSPPPGAPIASVGYAEPSLVFLLGTKMRLLSADRAADALTSARGAVALVAAHDYDAFRRALAARGWSAQVEGRVAGLDYSNGKPMVLTLYSGTPG